MAVDYTKLKEGDRVRYLGGDEWNSGGEMTDGKVYEIIGIDSDGDPYFENDKGSSWYIFEYNVHCFELVEEGANYNKLCKGDKLRYLGGDDAEDNGDLLVGEVYEVLCEEVATDELFVISEKYRVWFIDDHNAKHFELLDSKKYAKETPPSCNCKHDSHIVSIAKEIAELNRELVGIKEYIEKEAVLFDERLIDVEAKRNIVGESRITIDGNLVAKSVYFGGDSE